MTTPNPTEVAPWYLRNINQALALDEATGNVYVRTGFTGNIVIEGNVNIPGNIDAQIVRVNDGDTVVISAPFLPAPLKPELAVRVFGVDTPEKNHLAKCESERQRGLAATDFTKKNDSCKSTETSCSLWLG